jgi:O-antigen/teichoic acid export membrane protein
MSKSVIRNLSYNLILQFVMMVLPLISIPYVSRILGADGIGAYSFTLSLTQYFIIFGTLGTSLYGNRQIAYVRDDADELAKTFSAIFIVRALTTTVALVLYFLIFNTSDALRNLRMIQSFHIISAIFDVTWLFVGLEDFKRIVTRNLIIRIIGLSSIFIFVKTAEDVVIYTLINVGISLTSALVLWLYVPKVIHKMSFDINSMKLHMWPILRLFVPQIASQIYVLLDKTMIGFLSSLTQVGYYTQADRIIKSILELITALGVVMLPRMSHIFSKGDHKAMDEYLNKHMITVAYVSIPIVFGLAAISNEFVPLFFGSNFEPVILIMMMISPVLLFISLSSVLGVQYLLPSNRINEFTISIVAGALVNLSLNFLLIPRLFAIGAVIATLMAELTVMSIQWYFLRAKLELSLIIRNYLSFTTAAMLMFAAVRLSVYILPISVFLILFQVLVGFVVYFVTLLLFRNATHQQIILFFSLKLRQLFKV